MRRTMLSCGLAFALLATISAPASAEQQGEDRVDATYNMAYIHSAETALTTFSNSVSYSFPADCRTATYMYTQAKWALRSTAGSTVYVDYVEIKVQPKHKHIMGQQWMSSNNPSRDSFGPTNWEFAGGGVTTWRRIEIDEYYPWTTTTNQIMLEIAWTNTYNGGSSGCRNYSFLYYLQRR